MYITRRANKYKQKYVFKSMKLWGNGYPHSNMQEELFELLLWDEREREREREREEKENNFIHLCYKHGDAHKE